jgi:electron transport complex protein RnfG
MSDDAPRERDAMSSPGTDAEQAAPAVEPPAVPAWRLLGTLGGAGALAGLLIVSVYGWAQPRIEAHQARVLRLAIEEVLHQPERYDRLFVHDGRITAELPAGVDSAGVERVYLGFDGSEPVGFAIVTAKAGFQDVIRLIFGYDPRTRELLGMKVLESKETPGLGDKIEKDSAFVAEFRGVVTPLAGVKSGAGRGEPGEVDMITGATISSRTIIDAINQALGRLAPLIDAWPAGGAS